MMMIYLMFIITRSENHSRSANAVALVVEINDFRHHCIQHPASSISSIGIHNNNDDDVSERFWEILQLFNIKQMYSIYMK